MLYFVVGEATVYRINVDGTPENTIKLRIPTHVGHPFRFMSATYSD